MGRVTRRKVTILGATGSVGRSTLDLIARARDRFEIVALTAHKDVAGLAELSKSFGARQAVIGDPALLAELKEALSGTPILAAAGEDAVEEAAASGADWTMAAIVGTAGLKPVMRALAGGGTVALANKEALVSAGRLVAEAAAASGATLLPVDSEHNAIFQCFDRARPESVRRIILTASGGPFRDWPIERMRAATAAQAVAHPNWSMGAKISVDCATLMNKGLELIEAFHLFPVGVERLDLVTLGTLDFEAPDQARFPALGLARQALAANGAKPAILNAANEIAVAAFLEKRLGFLDIAALGGEVLSRYDPPAPASLDAVLEIDREARRVAADLTGKIRP